MRALEKDVNQPEFVPDFMALSVLDIDFKMLKAAGVKYCAFDADSTLVHYGSPDLSKKSRDFLRQELKQFKGHCIASNRVNYASLKPIATALDAPLVKAGFFVRKPRQQYFLKILSLFDARPDEVAMIGDKLVADVWGGNRAGLQTVWVERIGPDSIWDRLLQTRKKERKLMEYFE